MFGKPLRNRSGPLKAIKDLNMHVSFHAKPFSEIQTVQITFRLRSITSRFM